MSKKKNIIEVLGIEPVAVLRVKKVGSIYFCGCKVVDDSGVVAIKAPCGQGGMLGNTREMAVLDMIHAIVRTMNINCASVSFEGAKKILRVIEDSVQPKLFEEE